MNAYKSLLKGNERAATFIRACCQGMLPPGFNTVDKATIWKDVHPITHSVISRLPCENSKLARALVQWCSGKHDKLERLTQVRSRLRDKSSYSVRFGGCKQLAGTVCGTILFLGFMKSRIKKGVR